MPIYNIEHSFPLKPGQKQDLAERITKIHSRAFTTPSIFVQVKYHHGNAQTNDHFAGGKVRGDASNRIMGYVRSSPSRSRQDFLDVVNKIEHAWYVVVGLRDEEDEEEGKDDKDKKDKKKKDEDTETVKAAKQLLSVSLHPGLVGREKGFEIPEPGKEAEWFKKYSEEFVKLADGGDEDFKEMLEEVEQREDLKEWRAGLPERPKKEDKEGSKEGAKEEAKEESKEGSKEGAKEEAKEEAKEGAKEEAKS